MVKLCWHPDPEQVWRLSQIIDEDLENNILTVRTSHGEELTFDRAAIAAFDESHMLPFDDVSRLNNLHEAPLLDLLRRRFNEGKIYTACASVLISINPYKAIPGLYADQDRWQQEPHLYQVAQRVLNGVFAERRPQSLIVSGESGAGKTEACKILLRRIVETSIDDDSSELEARLLDSNPVLEAFGNAKTIRNDNSSRFGKFLVLELEREQSSHRIGGASIEHFLLERSRIVTQPEGERNYHIFYQMLAGAQSDPELAAALRLSESANELTPDGWKYLRSEVRNDISDLEEFHETVDALETLGIVSETRKEAFRLLGAVLKLGNLQFSSVGDDVEVVVSPSIIHLIDDVAATLGIDAMALRHAATHRKLKVAGVETDVPLSLAQAVASANALAKKLYDRLFHWLVLKINRSLGCSASRNADEMTKEGMMAAASGRNKGLPTSIGLLDIYGFEILSTNSFEQLCINIANEMLQRHYNDHIFSLEEKMYEDEGIRFNRDICHISDNNDLLELITGSPNGIMVMADNFAVLGRMGEQDASFLSKLHSLHGEKIKHPNYEKPRFASGTDFIVKHFAGKVTYTVNGFLAKNDDALSPTLRAVLNNSLSAFISELFADGPSSNAGEVRDGVDRSGGLLGRVRKSISQVNGADIIENVTSSARRKKNSLIMGKTARVLLN